MKTKTFFFFLIFLIVSWVKGYSQTILLDSVFIVEKSFYGVPSSPNSQDTFIGVSMLDKIQHVATGQFQQTTPGGLSTFLHRGFSNRHLPVMWNGFNIQSITNGSFDLSLIPHFYFQEAGFQNGLISSLHGNNTFSGGFLLDKKRGNLPKLFVESDFSTLQNFGLNTGMSLTKKNTRFNVGFIQRYDQNIFSYDSIDASVKRSPTNFLNTQLGAEVAHQFSTSFSGGIDLWYQLSKRDILNDTVFVFGKPMQEDRNFKSNIYLTYQTSSFLVKWNAVYSKEKLLYEDLEPPFPFSSLADVSAIQNSISFYQKKFSPLHLYIRHRYDHAETTFFEDDQDRNTFQAGGSWFTEWPNDGKFQISGRQDIVDGKFYMPSLRVDIGHYGYMLHVYNNYQLPNFNDLYYPFSGNPDLKPEAAFNVEITKTFDWKTRKLRAEIFSYWINNLIQWIPTDSTGWNWSPFNQQFVYSKGFEVDYTSKIQTKRGQLRYQASYGFTAAEIRKHETMTEIVGKQIIYMPRHKVHMNLGYRVKNHDISVLADWVGDRFFTTDNTSIIPSFLLLNAGYLYAFSNLQVKLEIRNLLNQKYQLVYAYPMPGVHARFTIRYTLP